MLPDLVRHPSFLSFGTFLSNVQDDVFKRKSSQPEPHSQDALIYLSVCDILIVLLANAMHLSTNTSSDPEIRGKGLYNFC